MNITHRRFDYALTILKVLCEFTHKNDTVLRAADLAEHSRMSVPHLEPIVRCLRDDGVVVSGRGPKGGYAIAPGALNRSMESIFLTLRENKDKPLSQADRWVLGLMRGQTVGAFLNAQATN